MPRIYRRRKKPNSVRGFCDDMTKNKIINSAAKIASKQSNATEEARELQKLDPELRQSVANFLRYRLDMTEQEFLNKVNSKLSDSVCSGCTNGQVPNGLRQTVKHNRIRKRYTRSIRHVSRSSAHDPEGCIENCKRTANSRIGTKSSRYRGLNKWAT